MVGTLYQLRARTLPTHVRDPDLADHRPERNRCPGDQEEEQPFERYHRTQRDPPGLPLWANATMVWPIPAGCHVPMPAPDRSGHRDGPGRA